MKEDLEYSFGYFKYLKEESGMSNSDILESAISTLKDSEATKLQRVEAGLNALLVSLQDAYPEATIEDLKKALQTF